jgi:hypothetical protein
MITPIQTFMANLANLAYAVRNRETVTIGGGKFEPTELAAVRRFMEAALLKLVARPGLGRAQDLLWDLPIHDRESAEAFLRLLDANGLAFHPDDPPDDIVNSAGVPLFNRDEADLLNKRMDEVRRHHDDPFSVLLKN